MQESSRTFLKRAGVAAATVALVLGGSLLAGPVAATAGQMPNAVALVPAAAGGTVTETRGAVLPAGLATAVQRDLGIGVEEFTERGELVAVADQLRTDLQKAKLSASFAIDGNTIAVKVGSADRAAVTQKLNTLNRGTGVELAIATAEARQSSATAKTPAPTKKSPASVDELYKAYAASVDSATLGQLQAVMQTANGFVIRSGGGTKGTPARTAERTVTAAGTLTPEEFAVQYPDVSIHEAEGPANATATNDVLGGMGYGAAIGQGVYTLCSVGFNGFNSSGARAAFSAGHCTRDGQIKKVSIAEHRAPDVFDGLGAEFGSFGYSQFGGPGNASLTTGANQVLGNVGTDISVLDNINSGLRQQPLVTNWKGADERDSGTKVTGVAGAVIGASVCKSGRTTGWTCGKVDEVGIFVVGGFRNTTTDLRGIRGFGMPNPDFSIAYEGDSGGSAIAGGNAVGLTSAISDAADGSNGRAYFTDINQALKQTNGYSLKLYVNAPKITTKPKAPGLDAGAKISGTVASAPNGTTVKVVSSGKTIATAKTTKGSFSFRAPTKLGTFKFTVQAVKGFNKSKTTAASIKLVLPAPRITTPKNGANAVGPVTKISGTGTPGATVKLSGDVKGNAKVGKDGKWSRKTGALGYGKHKVTATQTKDSKVSRAAVSSFKVVPKSPSIASPTAGRKFANGKAPGTISGRGISGATVKVTVGKDKMSTKVVKGTWKARIPGTLAAGSHTVTAVQVLKKTSSAPIKVKFSVAGPGSA